MNKAHQLVGCQTILWGKSFPDRLALSRALHQISSAGFAGVEFFQSPKNLGVRSFAELSQCMNEFKLRLAGLTGGSVSERLEFIGESTVDYLYADCVDIKGFEAANRRGAVLGIHPHLFGEVETLLDAKSVLEEFKSLMLIPDTAHVFAAGDDLSRLLESLVDRIVCVHLKDWKLDFGTSSHRYARGFCNLGTGDVPLDKVLMELTRLKYNRWIIWELDRAHDVVKAVEEAAKWMRSRGLMSDSSGKLPPIERANSSQKTADSLTAKRFEVSCFPDYALENPFASTAEDLVERVRRFHGARFVNLWENTAYNRTMTLIASTHKPILTSGGIELDHSLSKACVLSQQCRSFQLTPSEFGDELFAAQQNLQSVAVYPIVDEYNIHLTRYLLCVFPQLGQEVEVSEFEPNLPLVARLLRCALDARCANISLLVESLASRCRTAAEYCDRTQSFISSALPCDRVQLLFPDPWKDGLFPSESNKVLVADELVCVDACWQYGRRVLRTKLGEESQLVIPIRNSTGNAMGVASCWRQPDAGQLFIPFSDDDAAAAEAMLKSFCQRYEQMIAKERRDLSRQNLQNDLGQPINNLNWRLHRMNQNRRRSGIVYREDLVADMQSWGELIRRLIVTSVTEMLKSQVELSPRSTLIVKHVIAAVVRQSKELLEERGFHSASIRYENAQLPALNIDRNRFQEVFFNLLSNAIKYAHRDPTAFHVEIEGFITREEVGIKCRDWGRGIPKEVAELVFQENFRYNSDSTEADGEGLGLAMVRKIIDSHGGTVFVSGYSNPTEITIGLPRFLVSLAEC